MFEIQVLRDRQGVHKVDQLRPKAGLQRSLARDGRDHGPPPEQDKHLRRLETVGLQEQKGSAGTHEEMFEDTANRSSKEEVIQEDDTECAWVQGTVQQKHTEIMLRCSSSE